LRSYYNKGLDNFQFGGADFRTPCSEYGLHQFLKNACFVGSSGWFSPLPPRPACRIPLSFQHFTFLLAFYTPGAII
jgi:hypothetical protein